MTRDELSFLFQKYLERDFEEKEWGHHKNKNYSLFEKEIKNCPERTAKKLEGITITREELSFLFKKYLERDFNEKEWGHHKHKNYSLFEEEIKNCPERFNKTLNDQKIAILLTGHIRKNHILEGLLKLIQLKNIDLFVHTWDNLGLKGSETNVNAALDTDAVLREVEKLPNVKKVKIENNKDYVNSLEDIKGYFNFSSPEKFIKSQLYSINQAYNLMEEYIEETDENYSLVFKLRFDSKIDRFTITPDMINDANNNNIIFTTSRGSHDHHDYGSSCWACDNMYYKHNLKTVHIFEHTNVICDFFAYGSMSSMKKYCSLYLNYDELIKSFEEVNLESLKRHNRNLTTVDGNHILDGHGGHIDSLYYYYCSYPERLLQKYLKDYMLIESKNIAIKLAR